MSLDCTLCENCVQEISPSYTGLVCKSEELVYQYNFREEGIYSANCCIGFREKKRKQIESKEEIRLSTLNNLEGKVINNKDALPFILAGKSEFTIQSNNTGKQFAFKMSKQKSTASYEDSSEFVYFVSVLQNEKSTYAGILLYNSKTSLFEYRRGSKGKIEVSDIRIKSLLYILNSLNIGKYDINVTIYHCGKCGRCGKKLTTPESILTGLGPSCSKLSGVPRVKIVNNKL